MKIVRALPYLVSVTTMVLLLTGARGNNEANVIRATRIELVDGRGDLRGYWSAEDPNGVELHIIAGKLVIEQESGEPCINLGVAKDWIGLKLRDQDGKARIGLAVAKDEPGLVVCDANQRKHTILGVNEGGPSLQLSENGKDRLTLRVVKDQPLVRLHTDDMVMLLCVPSDTLGGAILTAKPSSGLSGKRDVGYVPIRGLDLLLKDYVSGNLGKGTTAVGGPYALTPSWSTPGSNLLEDYLSGYFQEMGRKAASPGF